MITSSGILSNGIYRTGLWLNVISGSLFCIPFFTFISEESRLSLFFIHYALAVAYMFILFFSKEKLYPGAKLDYRFLLLILGLLSAYSLNRVMSVFEDSVSWLSVLLSTACINYLLYTHFQNLPAWVKQTSAFISGISFILFSYLAVYLLPLYVIGIVGFLALGVSLHVFVPVFFSVNTISLINREAAGYKKIWRGFLAGLGVSISAIVFFTLQWNEVKAEINTVYSNAVLNKGTPAWVQVSQKITPGTIADKLLKAGIVYSTPEYDFENFLWNIPDQAFDEKMKHDPLVICAALFSGISVIPADERVRILKSGSHNWHKAEERLWSGENLLTRQVITSVKIWPACNIAYTEKTITVSNGLAKSTWRRQEEAIYTFYLPEGGVVTSLSLWINGVEEKSILTTKQKADSAYKTIVGVESRDPSVVHWREGNRVSLRVFPVFAGESRVFKLGITAPLARANGKLVYENIYFDGPDKNGAKESIHVNFQQPADEFQLPVTFTSKSKQSYSREGKYVPRWSLNFSDKELSACSFSFEGNTYSIKPYHKLLDSAEIKEIFLDINREWTRKEFNEILEMTAGKKVFVYNNTLVEVNENNKHKIFEQLSQLQFSLFPVYAISNPSVSLLITRGTEKSCQLEDLKETLFLAMTKRALSRDKKLKLFNLGRELPAYLKSLKEFRVFEYDAGDTEILRHLLDKKIFSKETEDENHVVIHQSDMVIEKKNEIFPSSGPDHILRLFVYNHILQQLGTGLFLDRPVEDSLVEEARKAYVVTPLSSLVVLESQKDYDRFGIKDSGNSLKNASLQGKGAAPEPHEWLLIISGAMLVLYVRFRSKFKWAKA